MTERLKYKWKKRPYHHQVEAVKFLLKNGWGGALLMEPRTGKTKVCIDYASIQHLLGRVGRVLILAPVNALDVWKTQIEENCPFPHTITIWDKKARKKGYGLPKFGSKTLDFVIVNYDALSTPGKVISKDEETGEIIRSRNKGGRFYARKMLETWQPDLVVLDESHRIKTPSARKSFACHKFHDIARYRIIATGTVVTKKKRIFDVYSQWRFLNRRRFLNEGGQPMRFAEFKSFFANFRQVKLADGRSFPKFIDNQNEERLHELVHKDAFSKRRDECFDLPARTTQIIHCPLEDDQSGKAYDDMVEDMIARINTGEITEASIKLVQSVRLRQLSQGLAKTMGDKENPDGRTVIIGSEKLNMLESRLEDLFEAEEKVIIAACFTADIQRIEKLLDKMKVPHWTIRGGVKHRDRGRITSEFRAAEGPAAFIGHPAAASEAIDLASAAITIWYSLTPSWVQFQQFRDRNALSGKPTFEEVLIASPTDQLLWDTLQEDGDIGKMMISSPGLLRRERGE